MSSCFYCGQGLKPKGQSYFNRIKTLRRWVYSKSLTKYESLLLELALQLQNLLPQEQVKIKEIDLDDQIRERLKEEKLGTIYELLVYGLCLLNQRRRVYEDHHWLAEREDQMTALFLLQPRFIPESMLDLKTRRVYQELLEHFYPDDFTLAEAFRKLLISKSSLKRHFWAMQNCGYIERVGGNKSKGYRYNVAHWPWKK